jgi:V/A-type H+-transporting ATPase subunit A
MKVLQEESHLDEIVKLVGIDALSPDDRLTLEVARSIREDFLQQDAMGEVDSYCPLEKQYALLKLIFSFEDKAKSAIKKGGDIQKISDAPVREKIGRAKEIPVDIYKAEYEKIDSQITAELNDIVAKSDTVTPGSKD